jgi:hypothetical protein
MFVHHAYYVQGPSESVNHQFVKYKLFYCKVSLKVRLTGFLHSAPGCEFFASSPASSRIVDQVYLGGLVKNASKK